MYTYDNFLKPVMLESLAQSEEKKNSVLMYSKTKKPSWFGVICTYSVHNARKTRVFW